MLPMFSRAAQALEFVRAVDARAIPVLLLETVQAAEELDALLDSDRDFEIHVGLNDMGISRGHASPFQMLIDPLLETISKRVVASSRRFAIGRLARPSDSSLLVPADLVCALVVSLGASASFVSQYFAHGIDRADPSQMRIHIDALRGRLAFWAQAGPGEMSQAVAALAAAVRRTVPGP